MKAIKQGPEAPSKLGLLHEPKSTKCDSSDFFSFFTCNDDLIPRHPMEENTIERRSPAVLQSSAGFYNASNEILFWLRSLWPPSNLENYSFKFLFSFWIDVIIRSLGVWMITSPDFYQLLFLSNSVSPFQTWMASGEEAVSLISATSVSDEILQRPVNFL